MAVLIRIARVRVRTPESPICCGSLKVGMTQLSQEPSRDDKMSISAQPSILERSADSSAPTTNVIEAGKPDLDPLDTRRVSWLLCVLVFGFYLFVLVILTFHGESYLLRDPDVYWHIAIGQKIWQTGSLPWVDQFSHTFQGQPWIAQEWLAQLALFGAYSLGGWGGVVLLSASTLAATYALLFLVLSRKMRLTVAIGVSGVAYALSMQHLIARPQIFVDPLTILWVAGLVRAVERKASPSLLLLPIMVLWTNLHAGFTFGLALGAIIGAEAFFGSEPGARLRTAFHWAVFLSAAVIAACITPYGFHSFLATFAVVRGNEALNYVTEWQPLTLYPLGVQELFLYGLLFLALYYGAKVPFWRLISLCMVVYMMFSYLRFASLFAMVAPILLAGPLTEQFPFLRLANQLEMARNFFVFVRRHFRMAAYSVYALLAGSVVLLGAFAPSVVPKSNITPAGAVDYMIKNRLSGNVYNFYNFGGYLIFRGIKTFVDGRTDQLFLGGFLTRLFDAVIKHPKNYIPLLIEYRVSIAMVVPDSMESQELGRSSDWEKLYSDKDAELYQRRR